MSNTKSEIIKQSVTLFNRKGFFNVSIKDIADAMIISPGNLTYHFKKKENLLSAIQDEILSNSIDVIPQDRFVTLAHFEEMFRKFYSIQKQYSFFFLDIIYLIEEYPVIMNGYKVATSKRFRDARKLVNDFIASGRLISENDRIDYDIIIHNLWMISTFWSTSTSIIDRKHTSVSYDSPMNALWGTLSPYLTEKGYAEYQEILRFTKAKSNINV